jgi:outer membrane protein assembly factor BamB/tetratricopeptide (TPR) repeat protein
MLNASADRQHQPSDSLTPGAATAKIRTWRFSQADSTREGHMQGLPADKARARTDFKDEWRRDMRHIRFLLLSACLFLGPRPIVESVSAEPRPARPNPLGELFRGLDRGIRRGAESIEWEKTGRDQLDIRPIQRPDENRRLEQALDLVQKQRWHDAIEVLQFLLEKPSDAFSLSADRKFQSLQEQAGQSIATLPPEGLRNYQNRFSAAADHLLQKALDSQDRSLLIRVSTRYATTSAGQRALELLAQVWQDEGELAVAARTWLRLREIAPETDRARLAVNAAKALARAGNLTEAEKLLENVPSSVREAVRLSEFVPSSGGFEVSAGPFVPDPVALNTPQPVEPVLSPRWSAGLIERYAVRDQIETLVADLSEQGRSLLPSILPLVVKGKVAFRTLRSLQVRDVSSGKVLWERRGEKSPEEVLTRLSDGDEVDQGVGRYLRETLFEHHQLTSLAYRDGVYAALTSDGSRLYGVECIGEALLMSPIHVWQRSSEPSQANVPWESNQLVAYDLETGDVEWRVGGQEIEPQFSQALAGTYFFGPPTPNGDELFIVGERSGEVSLFCLSAHTGEELWSQPLVVPGRPIAEDNVRRFWPCRPILADGLIVCETTCGWLTAIDRSTRRLKWACRYSPRLEQHSHFHSGYSVQTLQELNRRWQFVTPIVAGRRILVSPPEMPDEFGLTQPQLYCIDLDTGEKLWEQYKGESGSGAGLYVAGIWRDLVITVCSSAVTARNLKGQGEIVWTVPLEQHPSGRGLILNDQLLLPVAGKALVQIDLEQVEITKTTVLATRNVDLANLAYGDGRLVSLSYRSAAVFPAHVSASRAPESAESLARNRLHESQLALANDQFARAIELLQQIPQAQLTQSAQLRQQAAGLEWKAYVQLARSNTADGQQAIDRLKVMAVSPPQIREYQRLLADHLQAKHDWVQALSVYLDLLETATTEETVVEQSRTVRIDGWIGGRLQRMSTQLSSAEDREEFSVMLQNRIRSLGSDFDLRSRWSRALSFHSLGQELELGLAQQALKSDRITEGLLRCERVATGPDERLQSRGRVELVNQFRKLGWNVDARKTCESILTNPATPLPDQNLDSHAFAREILIALPLPAADLAGIWKGKWKIDRVGVSGEETATTTVPSLATGLTALESLRLLQVPESQRLRIEDRSTGSALASFPLQGLQALEHNPNVGSRFLGPMAFVMHRGVLHALAWPDRKIEWTWSPDLNGLALGRLASVYSATQHAMLPMAQFVTTRQFHANRNQTGYLVSANEWALLLLCGSWKALDPVTGEELWTDSDSPERAMAYSLGSRGFVTAAKGERQLRHLSDGSVQDIRAEQQLLGQTLTVIDDQLIAMQRSDASGETSQLRRFDSHANMLWTTPIPNEALLSLPDQRALFWLSPQRQLHLIDLHSGQQKTLATLPAVIGEQRHSVSILSDGEFYFIFADDGDTQPAYVNTPSIRFSGSVFAYDLQGTEVWSFQTPVIESAAANPEEKSPRQARQRKWPLNVLLQDFRESPLVLLVGERNDVQGDLSFRRLRVIGIDKRTGHVEIDWERPSESGGFTFVHVNPERRLIELRTYNERLQLRVVPEVADEQKDPRK